ncbi:DUF4199 domain-containing protein [Mucilaginibacter glaciei]|uniref:DUF4199 domain-containing protein n=1 Tax=Mucilaginibacter glaciei TaxID=2772109 RepID=A0A926NLQ7_9SPHI|nr:DUF4199 domain-containing protein [Mucilaginibacter glaciei]MBD1391966.1 DUF4199 domain-containing protein [Mucilaginibacter glaciei]
MKRNVIVFGLLSGALISTFTVITMAVCYRSPQFEGSMVMGFSAMLIAFSFIFVAVKNYRDKYNDGFVSFGKAFQIGLLISLIGSTMYVLAWATEYHFFMPDWMERYTAHSLQTLHASGKSANVIAEKTKEIKAMNESYKSPVIFTLYTYAEILPMGILVSLIAALILKRKSNTDKIKHA